MIYLIASESFTLANDELSKIINGNNIVKLDFRVNNIDDILAEASYYSMFNDKKYLIVKNSDFFGSDKIKEEDSNKLLEYFENPNSLTELIFVINSKIDMRKKITKAIKEKYNLINIPNPKPKEICEKLRKLFLDSKYSIDDTSLNYIVTNSLNNYDLAINECNKLLLFYNKPSKIILDDVKGIVAKSIDTNNFKLVDALVNGNLKVAFNVFEDLKISKIEPLALLSLIAREYRLMLFCKILKQKNYSYIQISNMLNLQDWQLDKIMNNCSSFKINELKNDLIKIANIDLDIKKGIIDKYIGLEKLMIDLLA